MKIKKKKECVNLLQSPTFLADIITAFIDKLNRFVKGTFAIVRYLIYYSTLAILFLGGEESNTFLSTRIFRI